MVPSWQMLRVHRSFAVRVAFLSWEGPAGQMASSVLTFQTLPVLCPQHPWKPTSRGVWELWRAGSPTPARHLPSYFRLGFGASDRSCRAPCPSLPGRVSDHPGRAAQAQGELPCGLGGLARVMVSRGRRQQGEAAQRVGRSGRVGGGRKEQGIPLGVAMMGQEPAPAEQEGGWAGRRWELSKKLRGDFSYF